MAFNLHNLKSDVRDSVEKIMDDWSNQKADWGIDEDELSFSSVNALTVWDDLREFRSIWLEAREAATRKERGRKTDNDNRPIRLPYPRSFERSPKPVAAYSFGIEDLDHSIGIGSETPVEPVYAIDGSDQVAYEFTRGHKGGLGIATYGWAATNCQKKIHKQPSHRALHLVPADMRDVRNFSLINFGKYPRLNPDSMRVRNYAALRRQQFEFIQLSSLVDLVNPGSIIVMDGFLKAMFAPPVTYIHEIGKKASRKGVIIIGVAKSSKIDMWLHFQEYWENENLKNQNGWIRPPAPILDLAFPSHSDEDANQYLYLGHRGRGIGIPIAATLNPIKHRYFMIDFNCYDFEAARSYLTSSRLPEIHGKFFPLTTPDRDFIGHVLSQLTYYARQITALGYPFPAAAAHSLVKIRQHDVFKVRSIAKSTFLKGGYSLTKLDEFQEDPHKIVDAF